MAWRVWALAGGALPGANAHLAVRDTISKIKLADALLKLAIGQAEFVTHEGPEGDVGKGEGVDAIAKAINFAAGFGVYVTQGVGYFLPIVLDLPILVEIPEEAHSWGPFFECMFFTNRVMVDQPTA